MSAIAIDLEHAKHSDPDWSRAYRENKNVPYYLPSIDHKVTPEIRKLLETYSKVPPPDVLQHVREIREKAWAIRSYPCTGLGEFLKSSLLKFGPVYTSILQRLHNGQRFLDIGCFIGRDLRQLVIDGAPADHLYGIDIVSHWGVGYEMFRDRETFSARFIESDILHPSPEVQALKEGIDIFSVMYLLHQWEWDTQIVALKQLSMLSRPGALVVGLQCGTVGVNQRPATDLAKSATYWHNPETFQRLWDQIGTETGTKWSSDARLIKWVDMGKDPKDSAYLGEDSRILQFTVMRTE